MPLKKALLIALMQGASFGLDIMRRVERNRNTGSVHQGNVYPMLRNLEREGLLDSWEGPPLRVRGGRPRRYYRLTALGRQVALAKS